MITLIIVDCQNDFITGTMCTKGARNFVEEIKKFIKKHVNEIEKILFTVKWLPYNHISFKRFGGIYPSHCVQYTPGACIEPKLLKYVQSLEINFEVSDRCRTEEDEQQGAFEEIEFNHDYPGSRYYFDSIVSANADSHFVICGVDTYGNLRYTIDNLLKGGIMPKVYCPGIITSDGGNTFSKYIKEKEIEKIV